MKKYYMGIDFGGTKVRFALFSDSNLERIFTFPTGHIKSEKDITKIILTGLEESGAGNKLKSIGIGIAGMVNPFTGVAAFLTNLGGLTNVPLAEMLSNATGIPVYLDNDVNVALLGESRFGVLKGKKNALYIAVGTGVGGAILLSGKIYVGRDGFAGEFGHITVRENGLKCNCGKHGCLETESSGTGIERFVRNRIKRGTKTAIDEISAKRIAYFAKRGDKLAIDAFENAVHYLALVTGNLINIFNPEAIVFGGGVAESGLIVDNVREILPKYTLKEFLPDVEILLTKLKNNAGTIGAARLAFEKVNGLDVYF